MRCTSRTNEVHAGPEEPLGATKGRVTPTGRRGRERGGVAAACVIGGLLATALGGCASPPSVTPLLRLAEEAVRKEALRVEADAGRDADRLEGTRRSLRDAYDADLAERGELDAAWVREATDVYVAAREALVRHELALRDERRVRAENLRLAADATERAAELLERQDDLITTATRGAQVWRVLRREEER